MKYTVSQKFLFHCLISSFVFDVSVTKGEKLLRLYTDDFIVTQDLSSENYLANTY